MGGVRVRGGGLRRAGRRLPAAGAVHHVEAARDVRDTLDRRGRRDGVEGPGRVHRSRCPRLCSAASLRARLHDCLYGPWKPQEQSARYATLRSTFARRRSSWTRRRTGCGAALGSLDHLAVSVPLEHLAAHLARTDVTRDRRGGGRDYELRPVSVAAAGESRIFLHRVSFHIAPTTIAATIPRSQYTPSLIDRLRRGTLPGPSPASCFRVESRSCNPRRYPSEPHSRPWPPVPRSPGREGSPILRTTRAASLQRDPLCVGYRNHLRELRV